MSFEIQISSTAADAAAQLRAFPEAMLTEIKDALDYQNEITIGQIQARKLSRRGPTTLGVVTNRLRSSARRSDAEVTDDGVESAIGSNVVYAPPHEFGIDRMVAVPAHTRKRFETQLGGSTFDAKTGRIRKGKPHRVQTGLISVRTYSMHMRLPARRPFGSTIEERQSAYSNAVSSAILSAWQKGQP